MEQKTPIKSTGSMPTVLSEQQDLPFLNLEKVASSETMLFGKWMPFPFEDDSKNPFPKGEDCAFYRLEELRHDSDFPQREAMENVLSALANSTHHFVYLLSCDEHGISIHLGVVRSCKPGPSSPIEINDFGKILRDAFSGNFQGSRLRKLREEELEEEVFSRLRSAERGGLISGIPSFNEKLDSRNVGFQGIERLINGMLDVRWQLLLVCEPASPGEIAITKHALYDLYNSLHRASKISIQHAENQGTNTSSTYTENKSSTDTFGTSENKGKSDSRSSESKGASRSNAETQGTSSSAAKGKSQGSSNSATQELVSKELLEVLKYLEEELLERLRLGQSKGMFKTAIYALADNMADYWRLTQIIKSIFQGDTSRFSPLRITQIPDDVDKAKLLSKFQNWKTNLQLRKETYRLHGNPISEDSVELASLLTVRELSLLSGLPTKEVPGIPMIEGIDFGLNSCDSSVEADRLELGKILHRGSALLGDTNINLAMENLAKHVFVAGVTGSGKTTTCQKILLSSRLPFMVIEPAKTEYRSLLNQVADLKIFTLGNERISPFRLNPFELLKTESVTNHVDMLKAAFSAAFPMEAAMPYMLEDAIYRIYEKYSWDISGATPASEANYSCANKNDPWDGSGMHWPTMNDLLIALEEVVDAEGFDIRLASDYKASLVSRLKNLTVGTKGSMLNCRVSIDFETLIKSKVVFEMDDLKDAQDKALMMGLIFARVTEVVKMLHASGEKGIRHLTVIEEAHRLLARTDPAQNDSRHYAVDTFSDILAEVRKYGEGLIIVDQIPNKLAPEVLKNTNTKLIHKLFARDDREAVGDTIGLNDDQKDWLSRLKTGEVIAFSGHWLKPIHAKVEMPNFTDNRSDSELNEYLMRKAKSWLVENQLVYNPSLQNCKLETAEEIRNYGKILDDLRRRIKPIEKKTDRELCRLFQDIVRDWLNKELDCLFAGKKTVLVKCIARDLCLLAISQNKDGFKDSLEAMTEFINSALRDAEFQPEESRDIFGRVRQVLIKQGHKKERR